MPYATRELGNGKVEVYHTGNGAIHANPVTPERAAEMIKLLHAAEAAQPRTTQEAVGHEPPLIEHKRRP